MYVCTYPYFLQKMGVFISPYIGLNLETKSFRAILEALNVIQKKEEVSLLRPFHSIFESLHTMLWLSY